MLRISVKIMRIYNLSSKPIVIHCLKYFKKLS